VAQAVLPTPEGRAVAEFRLDGYVALVTAHTRFAEAPRSSRRCTLRMGKANASIASTLCAVRAGSSLVPDRYGPAIGIICGRKPDWCCIATERNATSGAGRPQCGGGRRQP
jgi:hypothetical protein